MKQEIEIKIKLTEEDNINEKLLKLGGKPGDFYTQTTYGFFSKDSIEKGIFPRIRIESGEPVLTIKVRPKKESNYFERKEYSITINDEKQGIEILKLLGFDRIREFTKKRQEWKFDNVEVCLDVLYFGTFLEIEGQKNDIEDMVKALGFENRQRIAKAYLAVEDDYKNRFLEQRHNSFSV